MKMTKVSFEANCTSWDEREESIIRHVELALAGLDFATVKKILALVIYRMDDAIYSPHWIEAKEHTTALD